MLCSLTDFIRLAKKEKSRPAMIRSSTRAGSRHHYFGYFSRKFGLPKRNATKSFKNLFTSYLPSNNPCKKLSAQALRKLEADSDRMYFTGREEGRRYGQFNSGRLREAHGRCG
jgi:hypothetical protein